MAQGIQDAVNVYMMANAGAVMRPKRRAPEPHKEGRVALPPHGLQSSVTSVLLSHSPRHHHLLAPKALSNSPHASVPAPVPRHVITVGHHPTVGALRAPPDAQLFRRKRQLKIDNGKPGTGGMGGAGGTGGGLAGDVKLPGIGDGKPGSGDGKPGFGGDGKPGFGGDGKPGFGGDGKPGFGGDGKPGFGGGGKPGVGGVLLLLSFLFYHYHSFYHHVMS
jgi:hypothetical protein